jgi:hypothetical protein
MASRTSRSDPRGAVVLVLGCAPLAAGCRSQAATAAVPALAEASDAKARRATIMQCSGRPRPPRSATSGAPSLRRRRGILGGPAGTPPGDGATPWPATPHGRTRALPRWQPIAFMLPAPPLRVYPSPSVPRSMTCRRVSGAAVAAVVAGSASRPAQQRQRGSDDDQVVSHGPSPRVASPEEPVGRWRCSGAARAQPDRGRDGGGARCQPRQREEPASSSPSGWPRC